MKSGVYQIKNKINDKLYIGSSIDIKRRIRSHKGMLRRNDHFNAHLQNSYNKYGKKNFEFSVLVFTDNDKTTYYEQVCIDAIRPEYNIADCAELTMLGRNHTKKTKDLISAKNTGNKTWLGKHLSDEHKANISKAKKGYKMSDEARANMSKAHKGMKHSEETKRKMSENNVGFTGRHHTEETKMKLSLASKRYWNERKSEDNQ